MPDLPADLPTNWTQGQIISPNGTEVGLTTQHGYNYLMEQVNAAQTAINTAQGAIDSINQALESVAQESTLQGVATDVEEISGLIGTTTDTGGSTTAGSVMGKLNRLVGSAGLSGFQEFTTPGAFSFVVPDGVTIVSITACGGGGGGGYGSSDRGGHGGGGGAAVFGKKLAVTPGQVISGTIGSGGAGATGDYSTSVFAKDGGNTVITGILTLPGGKAGHEGITSNTSPGTYPGGLPGGPGGGSGGKGGYVSSDTTKSFHSSDGSGGISPGGGRGDASVYIGGGGGGGSLGVGGRGGDSYDSTSYSTGTVYYGNLATAGDKGGGGGGGCYKRPQGGAGGPGYVKFSWGVCMD